MKDHRVILQARYNAEAAFKFYGLPEPGLASTLPDRTLFKMTSEFLRRLQCLPFDAWDFNSLHGVTAVRGWRESVARCSMQVVEHSTGLIEVDFDLWNPAYGALPLIFHGIEVAWPGKTDPFKVAKGLARRGIKPQQA